MSHEVGLTARFRAKKPILAQSFDFEEVFARKTYCGPVNLFLVNLNL